MTDPKTTWALTGTTFDVPVGVALGCRRVGHDLSAGSPSLQSLQPLYWCAGSDERLPPGALLVGLSHADRTLFTRGLDATLAADVVTALIAELVQDHVTGYEFLTWPQCPSHPHPMSPRTLDHKPVWCCPNTGQIISAIGHLGGAKSEAPPLR